MRTLIATLILATAATAAEPFQFNPGDHVCLIGNATAYRMQFDGWLETFIHASLPKHNLVFRNLAFAGDELTVRLRSADFGSPDYWLTKCQADVIFAFFGYNESFAGEAGLPKFKKDLDDFITHTLAQKYNGKSPPRLVLFSPLAHEDLKNPHLPDGKENNKRLAMYTAAMTEVAKSKGTFFVDIFTSSRDLYSQFSKIPASLDSLEKESPSTIQVPVTINGVHISAGNSQAVWMFVAAQLLGSQYGGGPGGTREFPRIPEIRAAVNDKSDVWFRRYRTTDGYSIYGGRADLKFVNGQTNREVAQREMEVLDVMTANRDKRIWAIAAGAVPTSGGTPGVFDGRGENPRGAENPRPSKTQGVPPVDDSNTPPFIPVVTNKPGKGPNGTHLFLDGDEAIKSMTIAKGLSVNLFASEKQFPDLVNPVQMTWDAKGRLWVAVWPTYPHWKPKEPLNDKILILEDTKGTGRADKCTVFADGLSNPTGFEFVPGGVLVAQAPDLMLLKPDKSGERCESRERVLMGIDSADTHHTANSFVVDPGGAVYFQEGTFHHTSVETPWGPPVRNVNAGVYRFEPRTFKFETYIAYNFANPHGHAFDRWGRDIVVDGTGSQPYDAALFSGHMEYPMKHATPPQVYQQRTRPCPGIEILSSRHFPESWQQNLLVANVIGFQGILRYKLTDDGASFVGTEQEPLLSSSDPNFRPSDLKIGPDGALYFLDWHNPIIGHMQHNLRDPSRDTTHGRIYRVTNDGRPLLKDPPIADQPIEKLLELLKWPEDRVRARVRQELANRPEADVIAALGTWDNPRIPIPGGGTELDSLWIYESLDAVSLGMLQEAFRSTDYHVRAAATRVLCNTRHRLQYPLLLLQFAAHDDHPRVRLEAVRAASFFTEPEAFEICLIAAEKPTDKYLDFVQGETRKTLEPLVRKALAAGKPDWFTTDAGHRWYVKNVETATLAKLPRNRQIALELLTRAGVSDDVRKSAATDLAKFDGTSEPKALLTALQLLGEEARTDNSVVYDLVRLLTLRADNELSAIRPDLENLAVKSRSPVTRQFGFVALIAADKNVDRAWAIAQASTDTLRDLLDAAPMIRDLTVRSSLFPKIEPLVRESTSPRILRPAMAALVAMPGQEAAAFRVIARLIGSRTDRAAAVQALKRIPSSAWPLGETKPVLDAIISWVRATPADKRTTPEILDALQLADALALTLPIDQARSARRELAELGVRVLRVGTKFEQMLFDQDRLVVQAGKRVELVFENMDLMPHNFVILAPGSLEEIGNLADAAMQHMGGTPGVFEGRGENPRPSKTQGVPPEEREYVPQSKKVLLASKLAQPRTSQKLAFQAPNQPGIYPYVCTYPGHWRRMYGALYVVTDLEEYLADAEGYLAKHPLVAVDPLLKSNRPRKEWTLAELADALPHLGQGRSFATGQQVFQTASCISCHKVNGVGHEIGPDLTKLDHKLTAKEILFDILEPSAKICEQYQTWRLETSAGKVVTGVIVGETPEVVKLIENPLASATPVEIKKSAIASRERVATSIMPKGLLDKLTREEILDLLAFVVARGDAKSAVYSGVHSHGH